jgi:hypothetical protein
MTTSIKSIPFYDDPDIYHLYTDELREVVTCPDALLSHIEKWKAVWQLTDRESVPYPVRKMDSVIASSCFDVIDALRCVRMTFWTGVCSGQLCEHASTHICPGMEIRMPYLFTAMMLIGHKFGVPPYIALHQGFCQGPHEECF